MEYHPMYGLCAPERGWVPSPRYLLRRERVLDLLTDKPRGRLLEIGCGAGALLSDLAKLGYFCSALEASPSALALARDLNRYFPGVDLRSRPPSNWESSFDFVVSLEVLEHIRDDEAALAQWRAWLKPGGHLLLSVPAHRHRWDETDVWAGHVRRYDRRDLQEIINKNGFCIVHLECYGFPLATFLEPFRARYRARQLRKKGPVPGGEEERMTSSSQSGIERSLEVLLFPLLTGLGGRAMMRMAFLLQRMFSNNEKGNGYLLLARKLP